MRLSLKLWWLMLAVPAWSQQPTPMVNLTSGKSHVLSLTSDATRLTVGNPEVADVMLINAREIYLLGKKPGNTNIMVWTKDGATTIMDLNIALDVQSLRQRLQFLVPSEKNVHIDIMGDVVVMSGVVSDPIKLHRMVLLAEAFTESKKVINLMRVEGSQQVMLEVKVAEMSKTLLNELGVGINGSRSGGNTSIGLVSSLLGNGSGVVTLKNGTNNITLDAEIKKGLVKILAEPTITAISGQEGSFLAGGKIFIPVPQVNASGSSTIALEEREYGVGLKFTPTVLEDGLINLKVTPEVSELSLVGTTVTTNSGQSSVLPSITTRRASTTVQLKDGESFVIGGLIKSNVTEAVKLFPVLGDIPILGVLFRSTEYQSQRTELVFVVTPRLSKPLPASPALPTDRFVEPTSTEFHWKGQMEGSRDNQSTPPDSKTEPRKTEDEK
jgi:pilus assembly protein CpaC